MDFQLKPRTEQGRRFVELAESHIGDFASRASKHDVEGTFPIENVEEMKASCVMAACVPEELGGLGVESVHDFALGINRLGRGDGSTAIAATMHIFRPWRMTRWLNAARASGDTSRAQGPEKTLRDIGEGNIIIAALLSEAGTDLVHPMVEATKTEGGWLLNGQKIFATMSDAANVYEITCRIQDADGSYRRAIATVASDSEGIDVKGDWNALGMRSSGSHNVQFTDCFVPDAAFIIAGPWGVWNEAILVSTSVITLGLVSAFLGIAESAHSHILEALKNRQRRSDSHRIAELPAIQHSVAEMEINLASSRAMLERTLLIADDYFSSYSDADIQMDDILALAKDIQCTKWFATRKAIDIVDKALTLSGGSGYMSDSVLSRLYRDVRAGPFMQPFSPNEAFEFIGKVTLGTGI